MVSDEPQYNFNTLLESGVYERLPIDLKANVERKVRNILAKQQCLPY
jgi:hypothetical protein